MRGAFAALLGDNFDPHVTELPLNFTTTPADLSQGLKLGSVPSQSSAVASSRMKQTNMTLHKAHIVAESVEFDLQ